MHHCTKYSDRAVFITILLVVAFVLIVPPAWCQDVIAPTDAISREITVYNADEPSAGDAVSREITVFNGYPSTATDAISREFTVLNRQLVDFRNKQDGEEVKILGNEGLAVTAEFSDCIYIQTPWSHIGIKVTGSTASVGDKVNIEGEMATDEDGNRYITATSVTKVGTRITSPSMMLTRTARCEGIGFEEPLTAGQRGATDGVGSCVIGLYVKMVGKVLESDGSFWLDDGGIPTIRLSPESTGITASADVRVVTGIVTLKKVGEDYIPVLRASAVYVPASGAPGVAQQQKRGITSFDKRAPSARPATRK